MPKQRHRPEQIIAKLREAEVQFAKSHAVSMDAGSGHWHVRAANT